MLIYFVFELAYVFMALGTIIVILIARSKRHTEGISFYSQLMFTIASIFYLFYFVKSPIAEYKIFWFVSIAHVFLNLTMLYTMRKFPKLGASPERNVYDYRALLLLAILLAVLSFYEKNWRFEWNLIVIRFCNFTEALSLLPQIKLMRIEVYVPKFIGFYLLCMMISRIFRIIFWFQLSSWNKRYGYSNETYYMIILAIMHLYLSHEPVIILSKYSLTFSLLGVYFYHNL